MHSSLTRCTVINYYWNKLSYWKLSISYHQKHKSTANIALNVYFLYYFSYAMRYWFLIATLYWELWGGHFCAADSHHIAGVIPSNYKYEDWFQTKLITVHQVNELYMYTKFNQGMSTISDLVYDCSHVRGWSFRRSLSRCYKPISYHQKQKSTADKALTVHFFSYFSYGMSNCFLVAALYWDP